MSDDFAEKIAAVNRNDGLQECLTLGDQTFSDEEIDAAYRQFLKERRMSEGQLRSALASRGMTLSGLQQRIAGELRQMKYVQSEVGKNVQLNEREMRDFYRRSTGKHDAMAQRRRVSQIFLPFGEETNEKNEAALLKKAQKISRSARNGDFAKLAKKHSAGPEAAEGGDLGVVNPRDLHPSLGGALSRLNVGQVSRPIRTERGLHILKVTGTAPDSDKEYAKYKPQIQQALYQTKMTGALEQFVSKLRAKAYIEILD